jgi:DsbC/DsbD-like thiol-disulfide interchange protein
MLRTSLNRAMLAGLACLALVSASDLRAAEGGGRDEGELVTATLLADRDAVAPGATFTLGVRLTMKPHWHTYWINPGESGDATKIKLTGPTGVEFGEIQWPVPSRIDAPGGVSFGYENEVLLMIPVKLAADFAAKGTPVIKADVSWLVCKEECVKGGAKLEIKLPASASEGQPANQELFQTWRARLPVAADDPAVAGVLKKVEQPGAGGASAAKAPTLEVTWKTAPKKVEWFPVATRAVAIDNVKVNHEANATRIEFEPTVYKADGVPGGRVDSVLVFEDAAGKRVGVRVPVTVPTDAK